jgi:polysaccharide deacetylase family protein (PEP-CTERM system associated)
MLDMFMESSGRVGNALTIDLEDWRQLVGWKMAGKFIHPDGAVLDELDALLRLLSERGTRVTFFVLANVAQAYPNVIRSIAEAGHEIASHGWSHCRVYLQSPRTFRAETRQAKDLLEQIVQESVVGYRAAEFSITAASWWALEVLGELGFKYDSSVYPVSAKRYGVPGFPPFPSTVTIRPGTVVEEIPPSTLEWKGRRWPIGGGTTLALLPYRVLEAGIRALNSQHQPAVLYFHPYEFSPRQLKLPVAIATPSNLAIALRHSLPHNFARKRIPHRVRRLLSDFRFGPTKEVIND